jgi:membrane fusion protein, copper/silver efflux system
MSSEPTQTNQEAPSAMAEGAEAPPRGVRAMAVLRWALIVLMGALALASWWTFARTSRGREATSTAAMYHCPMHPQIVSDSPGECPICHMSLEPIAADVPTLSAHSGRDAGVPSGVASLVLSPERAQQIGVRTTVASEHTASGLLRVTAVVTAAEQAVAEVHVRSPGFVERLLVAETGVHVAKGQELLAIYSPEVFQSQTELVTARQWGDGGLRTADAARTKLELLGIDIRDIERVVASGTPLRAVPIYAPIAGVVTKKTVVRGAYVTPESALYTLEDHSRVYIVADAFAHDLPRLRVGTLGRFTMRSRAEDAVSGRVDLIYPSVDLDARTTRVRLTVDNKHGVLRPGDYGDVDFDVDAKAYSEIVVPRDAIVDTGDATYVFVVDAPGEFSPRSVSLGGERGDEVVVLRGVAAGERVVSGATFLVDSESRLRAAATSPGTK